MIKSLQILVLGILLLAPMAFGQLGSLSDYDGVLQTKFALKVSEPDFLDAAEEGLVDQVADEPRAFTLTSGSLIREYGLPGTARVYWVFNFDGPLIQGGLVVANRETGEIHSLIAEATQIGLDDFIDNGAESDAGAFDDKGIDAWMAASFALRFDIDGLKLSTRAHMKLQFIQVRNISFLRMSSVAGLFGDGSFDDDSRLIVTGGSISASGIIANLD